MAHAVLPSDPSIERRPLDTGEQWGAAFTHYQYGALVVALSGPPTGGAVLTVAHSLSTGAICGTASVSSAGVCMRALASSLVCSLRAQTTLLVLSSLRVAYTSQANDRGTGHVCGAGCVIAVVEAIANAQEAYIDIRLRRVRIEAMLLCGELQQLLSLLQSTSSDDDAAKCSVLLTAPSFAPNACVAIVDTIADLVEAWRRSGYLRLLGLGSVWVRGGAVSAASMRALTRRGVLHKGKLATRLLFEHPTKIGDNTVRGEECKGCMRHEWWLRPAGDACVTVRLDGALVVRASPVFVFCISSS